MSTFVCSSTSAQAYQIAHQQLSRERRETVENDTDGEEGRSVAKARQAQDNQQPSAAAHTPSSPRPVVEANKGQNVDYYA